MSAQESNLLLRDAVHSELTRLLAPGGALASPPPNVSDEVTDDLIRKTAEQYRSEAPQAPQEGRAAIITAGPPGAGKSVALRTLPIDRYRRIDPDEIKELLLKHLDRQRLLQSRLAYRLQDDEPVMVNELSGWVHRASTDVADAVRAECLRRGENFAMEGTLAWEPLVEVYVTELARADYEHLVVLDVEVPLSIAVEQARKRWWDGRSSGRGLGGRFISDDSVGAYYANDVSVCASHAGRLFSLAGKSGIETELIA